MGQEEKVKVDRTDAIALLPQPKRNNSSYTYHSFDEVNTDFFPVHLPLPKNTPCRLLLSKGKNGRKTSLSPHSVITLEEEPADDSTSSDCSKKEKSDGTGDATDNDDKDDTSDKDNKEDAANEKRIKVQYPAGSTYNIRRSYLLPIIQQQRVILLVPETVDYRRLCIVHTRPQDGFIEIGSDLGKTIGQVVASKTLGIDKSSTSVEIASNDYPTIQFLEKDVLVESKDWWKDLLISSNFTTDDLIVGIDINGNREFEAVRECLKRVLEWWEPRLVLVKSRSMFRVFHGLECEKDVLSSKINK